MIINMTGAGGGGAGLNFNVVRYATESALLAAVPKENTIGIITTTPITSWFFDAEEPETVADGMVWFPTGTSSQVEFNALKKNGLQVYPISAKQYVSGKWVDKTAKSYQGGKWVDWITYLYNQGNELADITGGWNVFNGENGSSSKKSNCLHLESATSGYSHMSVVATENAISRGTYSILNFAINFTRVDDHGIDFGISETKPTSFTDSSDGYTTINTVGEHTVTYDISSFDSFYVHMYSQGGIADVYKVWLS